MRKVIGYVCMLGPGTLMLGWLIYLVGWERFVPILFIIPPMAITALGCYLVDTAKKRKEP